MLYIYISTSPNLRHRIFLLLNTSVPNCHITLGLIISTQYLTTELSHSKPKYGLFNTAVSSTTHRLNIFRIYARNVPCVSAYRRRRHWPTAASTIDWSSCARSSIRRCFEFLEVSYYPGVVNLLLQHTPDAVVDRVKVR